MLARIVSILLTLILAFTSEHALQAALAETSVKSTTGSGNHQDWLHFNPQKFSAPERLIPAASVAPAKAGTFEHGAPSFPQDPTRANVIYGRGKDELPTAIYAKAFDVLTIGGRLFQAPAAGELKHITVNGQSIALYGTTVYTPLPDTAMVANPVQVQPFDPSRVFYKDKDLWPAVIYAEPGKEITIANQKVVVPAAGQSVALIFDASGHLKPPAQNSQTEDKATADKAAADKAAADKAAANKAAGDKAAGDKAAADKAAADKAAADKAAADKAAADKAAADKAAADKAAADKAAADKAAADKAAADKAAADKAADKAAADKAADKASSNAGGGGSGGSSPDDTPPSFNGGGMETPTGSDFALNLIGDGAPSTPTNDQPSKVQLQKYNLSGEWTTKNTTTSNTFKLSIGYTGATYVTAVIVDQGSGYIPVGQVRFKGDYVSNPFTVTVQRAYPGYTNPYWEDGSLTIFDSGSITIKAKTGNLVLTRLSSSIPSTVPSTASPAQTSLIPKVATERAAEKGTVDKARPKAVSEDNPGTPDFMKKLQERYDSLPQEVKDILNKLGYTIEVGYAPINDNEKSSFGWTDHAKKVIHISESAWRSDGTQIFADDNFLEDVTDVLTHEIGHALDDYKQYSSDPKFLEAWRADRDKINANEILKSFKSGDGDGNPNFSNETKRKSTGIPKGAEETAAEIFSYILKSKDGVAKAIVESSPTAYQYILSRENTKK